MNREKCPFWLEVKASFEDEKEADTEGFVPKHLKECRLCRQRLYEERRLTLLLDDLFAAYQKVPVPFLNLNPVLAGAPPKSYVDWFGSQRRFGLLAGGLLLSFLVVLCLFYRLGPAPEPIAPGPILVSNKTLLPIEKKPSPEEHKEIVPVTEKDEKASGANEDFGQVFWARFDRTVSAIALPQEIRALSRIPWPDYKEI